MPLPKPNQTSGSSLRLLSCESPVRLADVIVFDVATDVLV
jgi:hypothetical protein